MKSTSIDSSVLGGQGSIGSSMFTVANPAPGVGPAGGDAGNISVSSALDTPLSTGPFTEDGPSTQDSQYSTIGPIPED